MAGTTTHFDNSVYGFAFDYPTGWELEQNRLDMFGDAAMGRYGDILIASPGPPNRVIQLDFHSTDYLTRLTSSGGSIQDWVNQQAMRPADPGDPLDIEIIDELMRSDVGGLEAYRFASSDGFTYKVSVIIFAPDYVCSIACRAQDDDRDEAGSVFDAFLASYTPVPREGVGATETTAAPGDAISLLPDGSSRPPVLAVEPAAKSMVKGDVVQVTVGLRTSTGAYQVTPFVLECEDPAVVYTEGDIIRAIGEGSTTVLVTAGQLQYNIFVEVYPNQASYADGLEYDGPLVDEPVFMDGRVEITARAAEDSDDARLERFLGGIFNLSSLPIEVSRGCFSLFTESGQKVLPETDSDFNDGGEPSEFFPGPWSLAPQDWVGFAMDFLPASLQYDLRCWLVYDDGTSLIPIPQNGVFLEGR